MKLGIGCKVGDFGNGDEIIDLLALVLEVEAGVSKCGREVDDRLANFVDLFL